MPWSEQPVSCLKAQVAATLLRLFMWHKIPVCVYRHLLPAIRALFTHRFKCYSWQHCLIQLSLLSPVIMYWFLIFIRMGSFVLCFFLLCVRVGHFLVGLLFSLWTTLFHTASLVCVSSLLGFPEELVPSRNGMSALVCFKNL